MRDFFQAFFNVVSVFFVLYMIGYATFLFLSVVVGSSTLYGLKRRNMLKNELPTDYYIPVSVLVPAYNEAVTIEATVRAFNVPMFKTSASLMPVISATSASSSAMIGEPPQARTALATSFTVT